MKNVEVFLSLITAFALFCTSFISCSQKKEEKKQNSFSEMNLNPYKDAVPLEIDENVPKSGANHFRAEEGEICILFGYGFNEKDFYEKVISDLGEKFGLEEDGGIIFPVIYPDDLKNRIMNLYDLIENKVLRGLLIFGAPENTHYMVAKLQDLWDGELPFPVFSFFPQDDALGEEATANFVLEYERTINEETGSLDTDHSHDSEMQNLILNAVRYVAFLPGPLPSDSELHLHVQTIVGNLPVHRYTDSATGLQAMNHFVLELAD